MKTYFSFFLFFALFCMNAQEISDEEVLKKCKKEFKKKICLSDEDRDGVLYYLDECPTISGALEMHGCPFPDTDGDSVSDKEDKCPTIIGTKENKGCPFQDSDGDGVLDKDDICPEFFGKALYSGCFGPDDFCIENSKLNEKKYKELYGNSANIDYKSLEKIILDNFPNEKFREKHMAIVFFNEQEICGYPRPNRYCKYVNLSNPVFNENNLWNSENVLYLQEKLKKTIIPLPLGNYYNKEIFKDIKLRKEKATTSYAGKTGNKYIDEVEFYYIPFSSEKLKLIKHTNTFILDSDNLEITFKNPNEREVIVNYYIINKEQNFSQRYQYINNQWQLIETK